MDCKFMDPSISFHYENLRENDAIPQSSNEEFGTAISQAEFQGFKDEDEGHQIFDVNDFFAIDESADSSLASTPHGNSGDMRDAFQMLAKWDDEIDVDSFTTSEDGLLDNCNRERTYSFTSNNGMTKEENFLFQSQISRDRFFFDSLEDIGDVEEQIFLDDVTQSEIQPNDIYVPLDGESLQKELLSKLGSNNLPTDTTEDYGTGESSEDRPSTEILKAEVSLMGRRSFSLIISTQNVKGGKGCPGCNNTPSKKKNVRLKIESNSLCKGRKGTPCQLTRFLQTLASFGVGRKAIVRRCGDLDAKGHNSSGLRSTHTLTRLHLPLKVEEVIATPGSQKVCIDGKDINLPAGSIVLAVVNSKGSLVPLNGKSLVDGDACDLPPLVQPHGQGDNCSSPCNSPVQVIMTDVKEESDKQEDEVDIETISEETPVLEAKDLATLLAQFEESENVNKAIEKDYYKNNISMNEGFSSIVSESFLKTGSSPSSFTITTPSTDGQCTNSKTCISIKVKKVSSQKPKSLIERKNLIFKKKLVAQQRIKDALPLSILEKIRTSGKRSGTKVLTEALLPRMVKRKLKAAKNKIKKSKIKKQKITKVPNAVEKLNCSHDNSFIQDHDYCISPKKSELKPVIQVIKEEQIEIQTPTDKCNVTNPEILPSTKEEPPHLYSKLPDYVTDIGNVASKKDTSEDDQKPKKKKLNLSEYRMRFQSDTSRSSSPAVSDELPKKIKVETPRLSPIPLPPVNIPPGVVVIDNTPSLPQGQTNSKKKIEKKTHIPTAAKVPIKTKTVPIPKRRHQHAERTNKTESYTPEKLPHTPVPADNESYTPKKPHPNSLSEMIKKAIGGDVEDGELSEGISPKRLTNPFISVPLSKMPTTSIGHSLLHSKQIKQAEEKSLQTVPSTSTSSLTSESSSPVHRYRKSSSRRRDSYHSRSRSPLRSHRKSRRRRSRSFSSSSSTSSDSSSYYSSRSRSRSRSRRKPYDRYRKYSYSRYHRSSSSRDYEERPKSSRSYRSRRSSRDEPQYSTKYMSRYRDIEDVERDVDERKVIYVGCIENGSSRSDLKRRFEKYGPIVDVNTHFREHGSNYGFVTFKYRESAYEALEKANDTNLAFGGRRNFCKVQYSDLDAQNDYDYYYAKPSSMDYDSLLQDAIDRSSLR